MITLLWWHWALVGLVLILAELIVPSFFILWFGLGGLLVALLLAIVPDMSLAAQFLLWSLSSLLMVAGWFLVFKRGAHKSLIGRASAQLEGEVGMIVEAVQPFRNGRVRFQRPILGSEVWECLADEPYMLGDRVKVVSIEGSRVKVARVVPLPSEGT